MTAATATAGVARHETGSRRRGHARARPIGVNQILWNNDDLPDLSRPSIRWSSSTRCAPRVRGRPARHRPFPAGDGSRERSTPAGCRIAEVYAALACDRDGPLPTAPWTGRGQARRARTRPGATCWSSRSTSRRNGSESAAAPRAGGRSAHERRGHRSALARLLESLALEARALGHALTFHGHVGTYVETPDELDRLDGRADPDLRWLLPGRRPLPARRRRPGARAARLRGARPPRAPQGRRPRRGPADAQRRAGGFHRGPARARLHRGRRRRRSTSPGVLAALVERDYRGWIVVEQDTTWRPPSESAAISRAIIDYVLRGLAGEAEGLGS